VVIRRHRLAGAIEAAEDVDREHALEAAGVIASTRDGRSTTPALFTRPAKRRQGRVDRLEHGAHLGVIGRRRRDRQARPALGLDRGDDLRRRLRIVA
jgi:hypothetical protein